MGRVARVPRPTAVSNNLKGGYVHQWSIGLQREMFAGTVLDVAYVANRGISTVHSWNPNFVGAGLGPTASRRRFPQLQNISSIARSKPTAFQAVSFEHRFSSVVRLSRSGWEGRVDWTTR